MLVGHIDEQGDPVGEPYVATDFATAAFRRSKALDAARQNVPGVLIGGFGTFPHVGVLGLTHPEAVRPFAPDLLRGVPFCRFRTWPPGPTVAVEWTA
jgi:hypothetical protein